MWPYCVHFQLHIHISLLKEISNCLIQFVLVNDEDFRFKYENQRCHAKVKRAQSQIFFFAFKWYRIDHVNHVNNWTYNGVYILRTKSNLVLARLHVRIGCLIAHASLLGSKSYHKITSFSFIYPNRVNNFEIIMCFVNVVVSIKKNVEGW